MKTLPKRPPFLTALPLHSGRIMLAGILLAAAGAPEALASNPPKGICAMASRKGEVKERLLQSSCIEGITIDSWWSDVEPRDGEYDWTLLDRKIEQVSNAGKWALLRVASGSKAFPQWMFGKCKTLKIIDPVAAHPTYGQEIEVPIPWDEDLIRYKTRLYQRIGQHYAGNPHVRLMAIAIANVRTDDWFMPTKMGDLERWMQAGYDPEKLISAGKQIVDAAMQSFPRNIVLAIGRLQQDRDPLYVAKKLLAYAEDKYPGRLIAQINSVSARTVHGEQAAGAWRLLYENRPRTAGQMVWAVTGDNRFRMNGRMPGNPVDIMRRALEACLSYDMNYVEIYQRDALNPGFSDLLKEFNEKLKNPSQ
jgi:Beta-galactosidase